MAVDVECRWKSEGFFDWEKTFEKLWFCFTYQQQRRWELQLRRRWRIVHLLSRRWFWSFSSIDRDIGLLLRMRWWRCRFRWFDRFCFACCRRCIGYSLFFLWFRVYGLGFRSFPLRATRKGFHRGHDHLVQFWGRWEFCSNHPIPIFLGFCRWEV